MIKYALVAAALKSFSISPPTKRAYRFLGNTVGQQRRIRDGIDVRRFERARRLLSYCEKHNIIRPGDHLLEIGTGWLHWDSTILRLFYDVEVTLFDVWDNRQLLAYKWWMQRLDEVFDNEFDADPIQRKKAHALLSSIADATTFEEVYSVLGFRYATDPSGRLATLPADTIDFVYSFNVLEHVDRCILSELVQDFFRVLKPEGHSLHQIDLGDHLAYYDRRAPHKNYLRYSDRAWRRYFENDVQYFNRVQRPEWLEAFMRAGFELLEEDDVLTDISNIKVNEQYARLSRQDLACDYLTVLHRKPPQEYHRE